MTPLPPSFLKRPIAHRALHDFTAGRPENALSSVRAAMDHGYAIEIDLQCSADGVAIVFHDYALDRLANATGPLAVHDAAALGATRLKGSDECIPTLAQVLDAVDGKVPLLIEVKDQDGAMGPNVGRLERATIKALKGYAGEVAVMSFNPHSVQVFATEAPHLCLGLTTSDFEPSDWAPLPGRVCTHLRDMPDFDPETHAFISHDAGDLAREDVQAMRNAGIPVLTWTIKSAVQEAECRKLCDNITFEGYLA